MKNRLSDLSQGKENNLNLIRMIAASSVLITHSFALVTGTGASEPLRQSLGLTMGTISVHVFFIISGLLVTASLVNKENLIDFFWARSLRIFPALFLMILFVVFFLGPFFTTIDFIDYMKSKETYIYIAKCSTLIFGVRDHLPGVFTDLPFKNSVNGSLWTMPYEVRMYLTLAATWLVLQSFNRKYFHAAIVLFALASGGKIAFDHFSMTRPEKYIELFFMFFMGASFYTLRNHIRVHGAIFLALIALIAVNLKDAHNFYIVYVVSIGYLVLYLSYIPFVFIRKYNRLGDYSYGVYIYAFPIQQSIIAMNPEISIADLIKYSLAMTLALSVISWHVLEKRFLGMKPFLVAKTHGILRRGSASSH